MSTLNISTARLLGQVETEIYAGRMDLETGIDYMIHNAEIDGDELDTVREKLRQTAQDARAA